MVEDPEMEFTKVNLTKVQDFWQPAIHNREFFSEVLDLGSGFLSHGIEGGKTALVNLCKFVYIKYMLFNFFLN
jgi:hypothetical protein